MTSSGTYSFGLSNADIVTGAFDRIGVRRTSLLAEHMISGYRQANLALVKLSNLQPNLWTEETQEVALVEGTATYTLEARTIMVLIATTRTGSDTTQNDRVLGPLSAIEYQSIPNKASEGVPSVYWFNRQITPQITLWYVPDASSTYTLRLQTVRQVQDANLTGGETPDLPYRWLDWFEAEIAARLARIWKPELEMERKKDAAEAWQVAAVQDTENVSMAIVPGLSGYYR